MFTSRRLLLSSRRTAATTGAIATAAVAAVASTAVSAAAVSSSAAPSRGLLRRSPLLLGWDDAVPTGADLSDKLPGDEDGAGDVSFDFGEEELVPPAPVVPAAARVSTIGLGAAAAAGTAAAASSSSAIHKMELPAAASTGQQMRYPTPSKTVTLPDGTEQPANEYMTAPTADVIEMIRSYLTQRIPMPAVEAKLFTALLARADEFTADQLLDVLEKHFPPATNEVWGDRVKVMIRDRCMTEAAGMQPLAVARAIVLVGINGRSRRDVEFFKKMCKILSLHINEIKDPHTLCYVLVGLQTSRIRPPDAFLALVGRRFPVLNKKNPLHAVPAYRALTFLSRAEYPLMNPYRYLADRVMAICRDNLRGEGKGAQFDGLGRRIDPATMSGPGPRRRVVMGPDGTPVPEGSVDVPTNDEDEVGELSSEDLDILRGLRREDASSSSAPQAPAAEQAQQSPPQQATFGGWGQPAAPPPQAAAPPPPAAAAADAEEDAPSAASTSTSTPLSADELTSSIVEESAAASADAAAAESTEASSLEERIRNASAIPRFLKSPPPQAASSSQTAGGGEGGGEGAQYAPSTPGAVLAHFQRMTGGLSAVQFVRFLYVLAMRRAPRQQYLRPIATDLLVPVVPHLAPPTFMRLVVSLRLFQSEDRALLAAVLDRLHEEGPHKVCLRNLFELLRLFGAQSTPIDVARPHLLRFMQLCKVAFKDESKLRARDMLAITGECRNIYNKLREDGEDGAALFGSGGRANFNVHDDWMVAVKETSAAEGAGDDAKNPASKENDDNEEEKSAANSAETSGEAQEQHKKADGASDDAALSEREKQTKQMLAAVEEMFEIVERFAHRMTNLMSLGVLALVNAETLLEICRALPVNQSTALALNELREARRRVDEEEGGPDAYAEILDIDVREIFFRIQVINNYDTFRSFRPLPATMIQDFKGMLDAMRCDFIVEAVHVYEQAFPGTLTVPVRRVLARHVLEKMVIELQVLRGGAAPKEPEPSKLSASGKIIEVEKEKAQAAMAAAQAAKEAREQQFGFGAAAGRFRIQYVDDAIAAGVPQHKFYQPYDCTNPRFQMMLFNQKKFNKFVNMLNVTPLMRVRNSDITWAYVEAKGNKLSLLAADGGESGSGPVLRILAERKAAIEAMAIEESERAIRGLAPAAVAEGKAKTLQAQAMEI